MPKHRPNPPFRFQNQVKETSKEFTQLVAQRLSTIRAHYISPENVQRYSHGSSWQTDYPQGHENQGQFQQFSSEFSLKFEDTVSHRISSLRQNIDLFISSMGSQFQKHLLEFVSDVTEKSGNTVSASEFPSNAEAFLAMLRKIEFGVDREGNVTMPNVYTGENMGEKMIADLEAAGPEFKKKVDAVNVQKTKAALEREEKRKSKFINVESQS